MKRLSVGKFFGEQRHRLEWRGAVASTLVHSCARRLPPHSHGAAFFSLLVTGDYREQLGAREICYRPMTLVFHREDTRHRDELGPAGATFLTLEVGRRWLGEACCTGRDLPAVAELTGRAPWLALSAFRLLAAGALTRAELESVALELVGDALRLSAGSSDRSPPWLVRVEQQLCDDSIGRPSVTELAREAGVHPVHLARTFRRRHGMTIGTFALDRRIDRAKRLLASRMPLVDIAAELGFADQSHFTRMFHRRTGVTPGKARVLLRSGDHLPAQVRS
jgi:AraC family transcriptional regulator